MDALDQFCSCGDATNWEEGYVVIESIGGSAQLLNFLLIF